MTELTPPTPSAPQLTRGTIWARRLIAVLFGIVMAMGLLEVLLSLDPIGLRYIRDYLQLTDHIQPAPAGYAYAPGVYLLSRSTVTIQEDGTRAVPASDTTGAETLVFVGDSVTFGLGVSDDQTFVNLVAAQLPGVRVVDAAMPAFNINNIRRLVDQQAPDVRIVYMITDNDADPEFLADFSAAGKLPYLPWTALYIRFLPTVVQATDPSYGNAGSDLGMYAREVAPLANDARILMIGYDNALTPLAPGAVMIRPFTTQLSFADKHPDANGHREIADQILPVIRVRFGWG